MSRTTRNRYFLISYSFQLIGYTSTGFGDISTEHKGMFNREKLIKYLSASIPNIAVESIVILSFTEFKNKADFDTFQRR